ncbi:MAG TPA: metalloregulator ArsR/SmtB family transcription factor [Patescibacteria group bacterium]|nr:metalloregulator ArsR/SmtB family transcription factor [Patescibacteria group bacterium]
MVKSQAGPKQQLSNTFHVLSDPTRRDVLERLTRGPLTVTQIKHPYKMSLVAISKHLKVLERARLIRRQKMGREYVIRLHPQPLKDAYQYIEEFKKDWKRHLDALEKFAERNS